MKRIKNTGKMPPRITHTGPAEPLVHPEMVVQALDAEIVNPTSSDPLDRFHDELSVHPGEHVAIHPDKGIVAVASSPLARFLGCTAQSDALQRSQEMDVVADIPFPIPYQGSKRKLAPAILSCFPRSGATLHEPFCGSAAVSIAAAARGLVQAIHLNDNNDALASLWAAIIESPDVVADEYERLWHAQLEDARAFYDAVRDEFNKTQRPELLLYLVARCVKAAVRYNGMGEFNQSPDNRRLGAKPERMRDHIQRASALLSGRTQVHSMDYMASLQNATSADVVYMDPPYQGVSTNRDRRYRDALMFDDFVDALRLLNSRQISFIVSYDGRCGQKTYGKTLPACLDLAHVELHAGRSTQATFLGEDSVTYEALYLSAALVERLGGVPQRLRTARSQQTILL